MSRAKKADDAVSDDGGAAELQQFVDDAEAKGYIGTVPDPHPNEAYSLKSGPDSPAAVTDNVTGVEVTAADAKEAPDA